MDHSADLYRRIFSSHPHATILFGLMDGLIVDVNDAALMLYGYGREEMVGLPLSALSAEPEAKLHKRKDGSILLIEAHRSTLSVEGREVGVSVIREIPGEAHIGAKATRDLKVILASILSLTEMSIKAVPATDPARADLEEVRRLSLRAAKLATPPQA